MDQPLGSPAVPPATAQEARDGWENEGAGLQPWSPDTLPEGITTRQVTEYAVGPYRYNDRAHAEAELRRQQARGGTSDGLQNKP